ncbi:hypothetical protein [Lentzea sp. NEAU-D7]|uniref:hypothetical protein n=1 Tax=Lentzea sp. NEAU-D7 TaxID=2994667 RepID=UPI00224AE001|nr:hypothetical protein [Lentzea sp. NEAU-D7]MCX2951387.1 hypothetical protein [Lentzea sp. NEAU-D7]
MYTTSSCHMWGKLAATLKGGLTLFGNRYYNSDPINNTDPTGAYSVNDLKSSLGTIADTVAVVGLGLGIGIVVLV